MKILALLVLLPILAPVRAHASREEARLDGVEAYGTNRYDEAALRGLYEARLKKWLAQDALRNKSGRKAAAEAKAALEADFLKEGAFVRVILQKVSSSTVGEVTAVFDVVEKADEERRLPFRAEPKGHGADPEGLLAAWTRYTEAGWELMRSGAIGADRVECPAYYCSWGASNGELKALQDRFVAEVAAQKEALIAVLRGDADSAKRSSALYLLAYLRDPSQVNAAVSLGLTDPDDRVREAAMRVYSDMAVYRRDVALPVEKISEALDYPSVDDRTRALAVMIGLADHPLHREFVVKNASTQILRLLRLHNASNHDMALTALRMLTGQDFGRDNDAWDAWVQKMRLADGREKKEK
ncbi:MAG: HEAT repeat domain-containing protein [Elusimicrobiota bacterium]|jgi:hypothetical protein